MTERIAQIAYVAGGGPRPFYYANAHEKDRVPIDLRPMPVHDARAIDAQIDREGFQLVRHASAITDWTDRAALEAILMGFVCASQHWVGWVKRGRVPLGARLSPQSQSPPPIHPPQR